MATSIFGFTCASELPAADQPLLTIRKGTPFVLPDRFKDTPKPLRELVQEITGVGAALEHAVRLRPLGLVGKGGPEEALQTKSIGALSVVSLHSFEGVGTGIGYDPPYPAADTSGAVGSTQYVEWVNTAFAVFDKRDPKTNRQGPVAGKTLWKSLGGPCEEKNDGDPIVEFDSLQKRWLLSQFAIQNGPPYYQCVAVSASDDALGLYHLYAYRFDDYLNDYPKFGVWSDGYYVSFNLFDRNDIPKGARVCAFNRSKMLAGAKDAEMQCFDLVDDFGLLPSHLVGGEPPPDQAANYFLSLGENALNLYTFHVDWSDARKSTFTGPKGLPVPAFKIACDGGRTCIPQPGSGPELQSVGERLMYRLAYRRIGTREVLAVNHSVQVPPRGKEKSRTGIRWYVIFDPESEQPTMLAGTYSPDRLHRWMGSAAIDRMGNLALGYTVSGKDQKPSPRLAGRLFDDEKNALRDELKLEESTGTQTTPRWGDYSSMSVDPEDDCTFWYVTQYLTERDRDHWHSKVFSFRFPNCTKADAKGAKRMENDERVQMAGLRLAAALRCRNAPWCGWIAASRTGGPGWHE